jgi:phage baseplate assembly protein W
MAIDYGISFAGVEDLDYALSTVTGPLAVAQDVARELTTPRGAVWYAPEYGNDVRRYLNAAVPNSGTIAASVEATALNDDRVEDARARVTFINETLTINLRLFLASGPFDMVLTIDKLGAAQLAT